LGQARDEPALFVIGASGSGEKQLSQNLRDAPCWRPSTYVY
jgi:hypothetical protein